MGNDCFFLRTKTACELEHAGHRRTKLKLLATDLHVGEDNFKSAPGLEVGRCRLEIAACKAFDFASSGCGALKRVDFSNTHWKQRDINFPATLVTKEFRWHSIHYSFGHVSRDFSSTLDLRTLPKKITTLREPILNSILNITSYELCYHNQLIRKLIHTHVHALCVSLCCAATTLRIVTPDDTPSVHRARQYLKMWDLANFCKFFSLFFWF